MNSDAVFLNASSIAAAQDQAPDAHSALLSNPNPFVGLRPFEREESILFFGRDRQVVELMQQLHRTRFLAVVGSSGCGKSSLIRAGLIPKLRAGFLVERRDCWSEVIMKPGDAPLINMAAALLKAVSKSPGAEELDAFISDMRVSGAEAVVRRLATPLERDGASLLLLVDQFEELFRYGDDQQKIAESVAGPSAEAVASETDERARERAVEKIRRRDEAMRFVSIMLELSRQRDVPVYVVMTMRSDFLGDCDAFHGLPEAINKSIYLVPRLTRQQRQEAIENPVRLYGQTVAPRLLDRVVNDVGDEPDQLPVMQHALMRTWEEWKKDHRDGEAIDLRHYEAAGTFFGALSKDADNALAEMQPDEKIIDTRVPQLLHPTPLLFLPNSDEQTIAERMFQLLVDTDAQGRRVRRPARLSEIAEVTGTTPQQVFDVADHFRRGGRCFLMLSSERVEDDPLVDISHESFIRQWGKLSEWVTTENESKEQYMRLATAALRHKAGVGALLTDPELQSALKWWDERVPNDAWARRYSPAFTTAQEFLDASKAKREADERDRARRQLEEIESERIRQQNKRLRRFTFALVLLATLAFLGVGVSAYSFMQARASEMRAVASAKDASAEGEKARLAEKNAIELANEAEAARVEAQQQSAYALAESARADEQARIATAEAAAAKKAREDLRIASANQVKFIEQKRRELLGQLGDLYQQAISLSNDDEQEELSLQKFEEILEIYKKDDVRAGTLSTLLLLGKRLDTNPDDDSKKRALSYYERTLELFDLSNVSQRAEKISTLIKMGDLLNGMETPDKAGASKRYEEALAFAQETPQTERLADEVYLKLGDIYAASEKREDKLKAVGYYEKKLVSLDADIAVADENPDDDLNLGSLNNQKLDLLIKTGILRHRLGQIQKAEGVFESAVEFADSEESLGGAAPTLVKIGLSLDLPGEAREQEEYFAKALAASESKEPAVRASTHYSIGLGLYRSQKYEAALPRLIEAEKLYRESVGDRRRQASSLHQLGHVYRRLGRKAEALDHYNRAIKIYEELNLKNFVSQVNRVLKEMEKDK